MHVIQGGAIRLAEVTRSRVAGAVLCAGLLCAMVPAAQAAGTASDAAAASAQPAMSPKTEAGASGTASATPAPHRSPKSAKQAPPAQKETQTAIDDYQPATIRPRSTNSRTPRRKAIASRNSTTR